MEKDSDIYNKLTKEIIGAAIEVHKTLGPGLLESAYEACLVYEIGLLGYKVESQKKLPLIYKDVSLDCGYRIDILVAERVIIEIKTLEQVQPVHLAQLLSYLRLSGCKVGLLINFNEKLLKDGIHRVVNKLDEQDSKKQ